ncbi:MAG: dTDP-4-amino-4,6-dideoxygalactose transaminase [Bacteroidota bacterium]
MIPFNKPFISNRELDYIKESVYNGKISGNGTFTQRCHEFFMDRYGFKKVLLTSSCTDALEMAAILLNIKQGDEVIMPSYTFVSTANAFALRGATIRFIDSRPDHPGMDEDAVEPLVNERTKAIVVVHYAGIACDMDKILYLAQKYNLKIVEDAAQAIDANFKDKPLGGIGDMAAFSFHETKNIISGEGGMLVVNNPEYMSRAEIIWEKGTNRSAFWRGEVDKYGWVDIGSSFLPSDMIAAFLFGQLENIDIIQNKRKKIWNTYFESFQHLVNKGLLRLPHVPVYASNNAHMFYLILPSLDMRSRFIDHLKKHGILSVFHYISLHSSPFFKDLHDNRALCNSDIYSERLVRLPFYYDLSDDDQSFVIKTIVSFFE